MKLFKDKELEIEVIRLRERVSHLEDKMNKALLVDSNPNYLHQIAYPFQNIFANCKKEFPAQEIKDRFDELYGLLQVERKTEDATPQNTKLVKKAPTTYQGIRRVSPKSKPKKA